MPTNPGTRRPTCARGPRRGAALLMCLFVVFMVSSLVLNVVDTETLQLSAVRNVEDYERALYLTNAGVHHACAVLEPPEGDFTLRGTFDSNGASVAVGTAVPNNSYQFTILEDPANPGLLLVQSRGASGNVERNIEATLNLNVSNP